VHLIWIRRQIFGKNEGPAMQINCREELANYMEDDISLELRERIERHFLRCHGCFAIYDGRCKVTRLVSSTEIIEPHEGFSMRLYRRIGSSPTLNLESHSRNSKIRAFAAEFRREGRR